MQRQWSADKLGERWSLLPEYRALLVGAGKLGPAVQLALSASTVALPITRRTWRQRWSPNLVTQVGVGADALDSYARIGRSGRWHRVAIIVQLAIAAFDDATEARLCR